MRRLAGCVLALVAAAAVAQASPDVATLLFDRPMWQNAPAGAALRYSFERKAAALGAPFDDDIVLTLGKGGDAQSRTSEVRMFSGSHARAAGPFYSSKLNPVLLLVLEQNVQELAKLTRVEPLHLKNAIRSAWRDDARIVDTTIDVGGKQVQGTRIVVTPFAGDPVKGQLGALAGMRYTVEIADSVPGTIAAVDIRASGETPIFRETLRYASEQAR